MGPLDERMTLDLAQEMPHYQHSMIALPICTSPYTQIPSFAIHDVPMIKFGSRDRDQAMASYCGDWRGNETKAYMESLGLQPQSTDWLNGRAKEQMEVICPHVSRLSMFHLTAAHIIESPHNLLRLTNTTTEAPQTPTSQPLPRILRTRYSFPAPRRARQSADAEISSLRCCQRQNSFHDRRRREQLFL
jgi:hypothetical protein